MKRVKKQFNIIRHKISECDHLDESECLLSLTIIRKNGLKATIVSDNSKLTLSAMKEIEDEEDSFLMNKCNISKDGKSDDQLKSEIDLIFEEIFRCSKNEILSNEKLKMLVKDIFDSNLGMIHYYSTNLIKNKLEKEKEILIQKFILSNEKLKEEYRNITNSSKIPKKTKKTLINVEEYENELNSFFRSICDLFKDFLSKIKRIEELFNSSKKEAFPLKIREFFPLEKNFRKIFTEVFMKRDRIQLTMKEIKLTNYEDTLSRPLLSLKEYTRFLNDETNLEKIIHSNLKDMCGEIKKNTNKSSSFETEPAESSPKAEEKYKNIEEILKDLNDSKNDFDRAPLDQKTNEAKGKKKRDKKKKKQKMINEDKDNSTDCPKDPFEKELENFKKSLVNNSINAKEVIKIKPVYHILAKEY